MHIRLTGLSYTGLFGLAALTAAAAVGAGPTTPVPERSLLGVRLLSTFRDVLKTHGQPTEIQPGPPSTPQGGMTGGSGMRPGTGGGMGPGMTGGPGGPGGKFGNMMGGGGMAPMGAGGGMGMRPGMGGQGSLPGFAPGGPPSGMSGGPGMAPGNYGGMMSGPPGMMGRGGMGMQRGMGGTPPGMMGGPGGGMMGMMGSGGTRPGMGGGAGMMGGGMGMMGGRGGMMSGGSAVGATSPGETTWWYHDPKSGRHYSFLFNKDGRVIQIQEYGWQGGDKTRQGIGLGSSLGAIVQRYGWSNDGINSGDDLVLRYGGIDKVAFQLVKNKVVGITIAYSK